MIGFIILITLFGGCPWHSSMLKFRQLSEVIIINIPSSCVLIDDKNTNNIIVDFHAKKIKSANKEPAILMIDPFNLVGMDNTSETSDVKILRQFIYKTAPYLGI